MTKQELIVKMMDGKWWTHDTWDTGEEIMWSGAMFINRDNSGCDVFGQLEFHTSNLEGFHHYEEPKEQIEAWLWAYYTVFSDSIRVTPKAYPTKELARSSLASKSIIIHKCSETLTMIDKE